MAMGKDSFFGEFYNLNSTLQIHIGINVNIKVHSLEPFLYKVYLIKY